MWCHIMLTGAYIAGDNYNDLYSSLRLLLIRIIFEFYEYLGWLPINVSNTLKIVEDWKNMGWSPKGDHLW